MGQTTKIEWATATWNPWMGCRRVSPACAHCYADRDMTRYGQDFNRVRRAKDGTFYAPLKWKDPERIFTCSWSDFFIEESDFWRPQAWEVVSRTPQHTYLVLTKRIERVMQGAVGKLGKAVADQAEWPNVWLGVSVENQRFDWRIQKLIEIDAVVRFLSIEPLLGPLVLPKEFLALGARGWVIVGGESGPKHRPLNLDYVRALRDQCGAAGVPFFFKQHSGSTLVQIREQGRLLDGVEWNEIPQVAA